MDATPSRPAPDTPAGRTPTLDGFARFVCRQLKAPLAAVSFLQGAAHDLVGLASVEALKGDPARPRALEAAPPTAVLTLADLNEAPELAAAWHRHASGLRACAAVPIHDEQGGLQGALWVLSDTARVFSAQDIDLLAGVATLVSPLLQDLPSPEQAELERRVAEQAAELRAVLTNAYDAYVCMDATGTVMEWNDQAELTFGWSREEAIGRPLEELVVPAAFRGHHRRGMDDTNVLRGVFRRRELPAMRRDGTVFPCEVTITALKSATRGTLYTAFMHDISGRKEAQRHLAESRQHLEDLYENAPCGYYSLDASGRFVEMNRMAAELYGHAKSELIGRRSPSEFLTEQGRAHFAEVYPRFVRDGRYGPEEFDLQAADGQMRRISAMATALYDEHGTFVRSRTVVMDVTELHRTRQALLAANRQQHLMLDNEMVSIVKVTGRQVTWANRAFEKLSGYSLAELQGMQSSMLYADTSGFERVTAQAYPTIQQGGIYRAQGRLRTRTGQAVWVDMSGTLLSPEEDASVWMMLDITAMKHHQAKVEEMAFHDALTGLPNRALLLDRLKQAIATTARTGQHVAVCFGDLDGFKDVNDQHGHEAGDRLLCQVAQRLQSLVRANDTAARLGGDEFVLVLTQLASAEEVTPILDRAREAVAQTVSLPGGQQAAVTISFGVAMAPDMGTDAHRLLDAADQAMYVAKRALKARRASCQPDDVGLG